MTDNERAAIIREMTRWVESSKNPDRDWLTIEGVTFSQRSALEAMKHPETPEGKVITKSYDSMIRTFGLRFVLASFRPPRFPEPQPVGRSL